MGCRIVEREDRRIGFSKMEDFDSIFSDRGVGEFVQTGLNDDLVKGWSFGIRHDGRPNQELLSNLKQKAFQKVWAASSEPVDFFQ